MLLISGKLLKIDTFQKYNKFYIEFKLYILYNIYYIGTI